jgi:hypothetical protein
VQLAAEVKDSDPKNVDKSPNIANYRHPNPFKQGASPRRRKDEEYAMASNYHFWSGRRRLSDCAGPDRKIRNLDPRRT